MAGPFYLAMVEETETTFNSSHHRMDEYVYEATRVLSEGEPPKLNLVIENPRVGLLSSLREQYCWFAWDNGIEIVPLFFGRILGIPNDLQDGTLAITFIAKPKDYKKQLQNVAETLKVPPAYDPIFTDVSKRDDPMAIFEAQSKMVCIDPVTNVVSASDIIDAEDGNVDFTADDHFYDSLHVSPGTVPKTAVHVDANVSWTQTARGYLDMGKGTYTTYTGDGLISEWPKPLSSFANGFTVFSALAVDVTNTSDIVTTTVSGSWQNKEKTHNDGDALSSSWSWTAPQIHGEYLDSTITLINQIGLQDPSAVDGNGDPAPINRPASVNETHVYVPKWTISTSLIVEYQAARPHTERIVFTLFANVQATTLDPATSEDSETITISGSDVGLPIIDLKNWTTVSGTHVDVGTVVFPDDPHFPGSGTAQIATAAGTAGDVEPDFSEVVGDTTVDSGVTWASLGVAAPSDNAPDWTKNSNVETGTIILPRQPLYVTKAAFVAQSQLSFPPTDVTINEGTYLQLADGTFEVCTISGILDSTATMVPLAKLPDGKTVFIAKQGGTTGPTMPIFDTALYATTGDNDVIWVAVALGEIPIGGTPGNVTASTYFGIDRGEQSFLHLVMRARARLRYASRCVAPTFQCHYASGGFLRLRHSVSLHDGRIPGGVLAGKVTGTELIASGGAFTCNVTLGSCVGKAGTIVEVPGEATYVDDDYVEDDYQVHDGRLALLPVVSDVGYSPLVPVADEDGITFPLEKSMFVVSEQFINGDQETAIRTGFRSMVEAAQRQMQPISNLGQDEIKQRDIALLQSNGVAEQLKKNPSYLDWVLKPLNGSGTFNHVYRPRLTDLELPQMINLEEESTS